ncbi:MAG TPA: hypothetical protein VMP67_05505, partial [Candidatus Limnocylindria bacterium]|nr:hypothetical protein [Candidatus Limnocylindria bacterium]
LAARFDMPAVAVVFDLSPGQYLAHNRLRPGRRVEDDVVAAQSALMGRALAAIAEEGFDRLFVLREPQVAGALTVERTRADMPAPLA